MSFTDEYGDEHEFHPRLQPIVPPKFEEQGFCQKKWDEWRMREIDLMFSHDADGLGMLEIAEYASIVLEPSFNDEDGRLILHTGIPYCA